MHRCARTAGALGLALGMTASPAVADEAAPRSTHMSVYEVSPRPGHAVALEEALRRHARWARQQGSGLDWKVFAVTAGKRVGSYLIMSGDHSWEDLDANRELAAEAAARWRANVSAHVASVGGGIYRFMADYSRVPDGVNAYPLAVVSVFSMRPTSARAYMRNLRKVTDALKTQESAPPALWFQQVAGGEQGTFLNIRPFRKWDEWPNEASSRAMANAMDPGEIAAIVAELAKVILREETRTIALRPDLSSRP